MSSLPTTRWNYLERDPLSSQKQLSIKGRRIKARTLYGQHVNAEEPRTVEQIAADYNLPIEAVREAIAYCESKPPEIEEDWRVEEALMEASGMNDPNYKYDPKRYYKMIPPEEKARIIREIRGE
jgi:uncharacterized protein (DUF433 family)